MNDIVAALSWGASAFLTGALSSAGQDAYQKLKDAVLRIVSARDVEKLEENPASESRKGVIAEELEEAGKAEDLELVKLARTLVSELKNAGVAGGATGFSLEDVEAVNLRLQRIAASGNGVSIKKSKFTGDIEASDVAAGVPSSGKPERQ